MTGYVRKDTTNNIADGNVINAADLDSEFDGVQDAFNASTGHKHDGTAGEGAPINELGPTQDVTVSSTLLAPKTTNTVDIGSSALKFKDLFLAGNASVGGTLAVTGVATLGAGAILNTPASVTLTNATGLPISTGVSGLGTGIATFLATPSSANLLAAVTNETGTGSLVFATSPTLVTPTLGVATATSLQGIIGNVTPAAGAFTSLTASTTLGVTGVSTLTGGAVVEGLTVGRGAGAVSTNTAVGASALDTNVSSGNTVAVGYRALYLATTGTNNTALGHNTLAANTTGSHNLAVGSAALNVNTTGSYNTAIGRVALVANTTGIENTAVGYQALVANTTASYNTAVGRNSLVACTTGTHNTVIGHNSGDTITTGTKNTILGRYNGNQGSLDIRTASNYIVLSDGDGNPRQFWHSDGYWQYNNNTQLRLPSTGGTGYIGYVADSSSIQISYNSAGNGVRLTSGATSWSTWSDQRLKNVTGTYTTPLADISQLQPIKFTWKSDEENKPQVGILAQSVQPVVPEAVEEGTISLEDETKYLTVRYTELIPLMVASIKELKTIVDAQAAEIAELKAR